MINLYRKRCSHSSCTTCPTFNANGSEKPLYCKQHALNGMVDANSNRCSHDSCTRTSRWGILAEGLASVCFHHKDNRVAGLVFDFKQGREFSGCRFLSRWGLVDAQPTHCTDHGRFRDGLTRTVGTDRRKASSSTPSFRAQRGGTFYVKTECFYSNAVRCTLFVSGYLWNSIPCVVTTYLAFS